jgi:hypothetical protein
LAGDEPVLFLGFMKGLSVVSWDTVVIHHSSTVFAAIQLCMDTPVLPQQSRKRDDFVIDAWVNVKECKYVLVERAQFMCKLYEKHTRLGQNFISIFENFRSI